MSRKQNTTTDNTWDIEKPIVDEQLQYVEPIKQQSYEPDFDLEGLMNDFPTAKELERFVYDQRGIVLNLKGRANKLKYQVAMDVLNGHSVDEKFIGGENPYIDKNDLVPVDPIKPKPPRDENLPDHKQIQNTFYVPTFPHPDSEARAKDMKCHMMFRKYKNGIITYEILGPLVENPIGEKLDKFGRTRPEVIKWYDPRTGEKLLQREDGTLTPQGRRLRATMMSYKVNRSNQWDTWVDRDFSSIATDAKDNPWDLSKA